MGENNKNKHIKHILESPYKICIIFIVITGVYPPYFPVLDTKISSFNTYKNLSLYAGPLKQAVKFQLFLWKQIGKMDSALKENNETMGHRGDFIKNKICLILESYVNQAGNVVMLSGVEPLSSPVTEPLSS